MTHYIQGKEGHNDFLDPVLEDLGVIVPDIKAKTWGSEEILHNDKHCVKIMRLSPGHQVSMHWHAKKIETFILISGTLKIETLTQEGELRVTELTNQLESFTLYKNVPHTFYCPKGQSCDTVFIEASTQDNVNDSFRIFPSR